jgi:hypothetical protein
MTNMHDGPDALIPLTRRQRAQRAQEVAEVLDVFNAPFRAVEDRARAHRWQECGYRADFASEATHDRECPGMDPEPTLFNMPAPGPQVRGYHP